ncbi:hypothetical protein GALMADRAFT_240570 [Galerina marginata CBS 339.88]|uniref:Uncharacterized protein n=1 Tax=Galerina marginata (strain CBS 339.88) TaxID=685588 RepID=A0A067TG19_GALM3|nr:hypothetical protein GALMADRAFT_240570 [Galerina marginata CBS 339.88]
MKSGTEAFRRADVSMCYREGLSGRKCQWWEAINHGRRGEYIGGFDLVFQHKKM